MIDGLKLKNQFHYDEEKYMKRAMEKQNTDPTGYKCQHDSITEKRNLKVSQRIKEHMEKNPNLSSQKNNLQAADNEGTVNDKIRFYFNTSFISDRTDPYACYEVGQKISVGDTTANVACSSTSDSACIYTCTEADIQSSALQNFIKSSIIETIKEVFESRIKIRNPNENIKFNYLSNDYTCDYGVDIPNSFFTQGIENIDMYVWVTSRPTPSNNTIAYAFSCNFDTSSSIYGRPTAASINFNPLYFTPFINAENSISFNEYVRVGIHEMTHALGFSSTFYQSFIVPNTNDVINDGDGAAKTITIKDTTPSGESFSYKKNAIYSPGVVEFAKQHYKCDSIEYQELEDYGGSGTAGSHWEARTAGEEYMIGFVSPIMPITNLSLSLLQDSGWYVVDGSDSDPFLWGKSLGCDFVKKQCSDTTWNYQGYFCTEDQAVSCTGTRMGKGVCSIITLPSSSKELYPQYQHFKDPRTIGINFAADGCPFYQVQDNNVYCFDTSKSSTANADVYETYCENCRCFEYASDNNKTQQACWEQRCGDKGLQLKINNQWFDCPDSSTIVAFDVSIMCPKGSTFCGGTPVPINIVSGNPASVILPTLLLSIISLSLLFLIL
ncbi:hypothetical protein DICPUDRAFT_38410 [Dictyostelium purpureum]|uniref:Uncharacterized protein n=1 Tax=Dictyostelium purpureum TaxID=5786 RepID=F0ZUE1_DICPU|nr:uncharacterized protein DICPUDRAFT_38410 [Dictyostelium purpureum]EGC32423.1 hypothetical protein DICPUDRAFT_38410 [Dictyostelium purpureum]|eukprot:XP_003291035.1 hypothetical protein DICPUDRAFT_38410 [Dictyostelium purpureum]